MIKYTRRTFLKLISLFGISLALIDIFFIERLFIDVKEFSLNTNNRKNSDTAIYTIILISDLHLKEINSIHSKISKIINKKAPDFLLINGDSIDRPENLKLLNVFLSKINPEIKKVSTLGNWEYWSKVNLQELTEIYKQNNCDLLINKSKKYKIRSKTITIVGVDDFIGGIANFDLAMKKFEKSNFNLLLSHCPEYRDKILVSDKSRNIDLILSGHTHGGQINILGYSPFKPKGSGKYLKGWYKEDKPNLYVSKGIGTSIFPIRFGSMPEITIFNIFE